LVGERSALVWEVWAVPKRGKKKHIALIDSWEPRELNAEEEANARLIASAPRLLELVQGCLGYFEDMKAQRSKDAPDDKWLAPLRAAAKGA
jgi:hypothetical protein